MGLRFNSIICRHFVVACVAVTGLLAGASQASAQSGGTTAPGGGTTASGPVGKAILKPSGMAMAPANAPTQVINAIAAANRIRHKPYVWGGGHGSWEARGYDCSGAEIGRASCRGGGESR